MYLFPLSFQNFWPVVNGRLPNGLGDDTNRGFVLPIKRRSICSSLTLKQIYPHLICSHTAPPPRPIPQVETSKRLNTPSDLPAHLPLLLSSHSSSLSLTEAVRKDLEFGTTLSLGLKSQEFISKLPQVLY